MSNARVKILRFYEKYMFLIGGAGHFLFILQAYEIIKNQSAHDVSLPGLSVAFLSMAAWFFYGVLRKDKALIMANSFGLLASFGCIIATIIFK